MWKLMNELYPLAANLQNYIRLHSMVFNFAHRDNFTSNNLYNTQRKQGQMTNVLPGLDTKEHEFVFGMELFKNRVLFPL
jgi:hypothetical protein